MSIPLVSKKQLEIVLDSSLSDSAFTNYLNHIEILQPAAGKLFWQANSATAGLCIVLSGKVRLLDDSDCLVSTLETGSSFGALTLFSSEHFLPYAARASLDLTLGFLVSDVLDTIFKEHPTSKKHLHQQAVLQDLTLISRQHPQLASLPSENIRDLMSGLTLHQLLPGKLPVETFVGKALWLLRQGTLKTQTQILPAGSLHLISQEQEEFQQAEWQVEASAELYSLSDSDWAKIINDTSRTTRSNNDSSTNWSIKLAQRKILTSKDKAAKQSLAQSNSKLVSANKQKVNQAYFPNPSIKVSQLWQNTIQHYPFYEQQSASDCGVACLVMIGRYWGKRFSLNHLREIAHVDRSGSSLQGLSNAAETIGLTARPVKARFDGLTPQHLPAIAHWEGKHYIVVYKINRKSVIVCDPAIGQQRLSHSAFQTKWTGYTLLLRPKADLGSIDEAKQPFWQFLKLAKPHRLVLLEVFAASILLQLFGLTTPLFTQLLLDRVVVQRSLPTLNAVGAGLLIFGLFSVVLSALREYLLDHTANRIDMALIVGFVGHTLQLPLNYFESRYVGDIISRIQENEKIQRFLTDQSLSILMDLLTVFIYISLMLWYSWRLTFVTLLVIPFYVLLAWVTTPFLRRLSREIFAASNNETAYLIQSLTGIRTIKSMAIEQTVRWQWEEHFVKAVKVKFSGQILGNLLQSSSTLIETLAVTGLLWFGAWQVIQNQLTIGQLVAFNMLLGNVISPFKRFTMLWDELQEVGIAIERINDVVAAAPEEDFQQQSRYWLPSTKGHIRFENVTFRYTSESKTNILENISFEVESGQIVALVGRSGSGKTTLSKLLLGLYPLSEGEIFIDGHKVSNLSVRSLRKQIGVVDQETFLFGGTIRENLSIRKPSISQSEVIEAASLAGADSFIKELPMGYETQIGEGGSLLSGGQRQRLAIARAILDSPKILILDEATSSLDTESERVIQNNLNRISRARTTLVIAHRLSTVRSADLILVLDRGVIVERGTHDQLMAKQGQYFYLNQQQLSQIQ